MIKIDKIICLIPFNIWNSPASGSAHLPPPWEAVLQAFLHQRAVAPRIYRGAEWRLNSGLLNADFIIQVSFLLEYFYFFTFHFA